MSFSKVSSAQTSLLKAHIIDIEVDIAKGLHSFSVVGLPDKAVEESRDRVGAAIKNSDFESPKSKNHKTTISLAPADLKKEGPLFDVGIALAYLLATKQIVFKPKGKLFLGELSLDGGIRRVSGVLPLAREAQKRGFEELYVPEENAREAALIEGIAVYGAKTLQELIEHLNEQNPPEKRARIKVQPTTKAEAPEKFADVNFKDIKGQESAKRGLEIAAAGGHNVAMWGPPGTGKTMLAKAFSHILPALSFEDILETTAIHSVAGTLEGDLVIEPPLRAPHHTSSYVALVGGGAIPKPGEITLAHKGVLFLDEFPEFDRRVIEALRQPLEERVVSVSRARGNARFPAHFILIAAMNPCPCGNYGDREKSCVCMPASLLRYQRKISGPIVDRIDMWVEVGRIKHAKLSEEGGGEETSAIRERVGRARDIQEKRFKKHGFPIRHNSEMGAKQIAQAIKLGKDVEAILNRSAEKLGLSARAYHRVIKLARTIADLDSADDIREKHLLEALQYRPKSFASL